MQFHRLLISSAAVAAMVVSAASAEAFARRPAAVATPGAGAPGVGVRPGLGAGAPGAGLTRASPVAPGIGARPGLGAGRAGPGLR